jgi:DNA-binding CsgD family transcriptional regulator
VDFLVFSPGTEIIKSFQAEDGEVILLEGHAASGKTTILHEYAAHAVAEGSIVFRATAARAERKFQLGVIRQLLAQSGVTSTSSDEVANLFEDERVLRYTTDESWRLPTPIMDALWSWLLGLSQKQPLVLIVDDFHYADTASKECILYFARRVKSVPLLLLLAEDAQAMQKDALLQAELLRLPNCRTVRLRPFSRQEVERLMFPHYETRRSVEFAAAIHRASGGNPGLALALIDDCQAAEGELVTGHAFDFAVLNCLSRCDPQALRLASALAVLGGTPSKVTLASMLGVPGTVVDGALAELTTMGLVSAGRFRHPSIGSVVLGMLSSSDLADLHARAAQVLYEEKAAIADVVMHLLTAMPGPAEAAEHPWVPGVLRETAADAARGGDLELAVNCLCLAVRLCEEPADRAILSASLTEVRWLANPATAFQYLPGLGQSVRDGYLNGLAVAKLVHRQLWAGRIPHAAETLAHALQDQSEDPVIPELLAASLWLPSLCPDIEIPSGASAEDYAVSPHLQAARTACAVFPGPGTAPAHRTRIPDIARLDDIGLSMIAVAASVVATSAEAGTLAQWTTVFLDDTLADEAVAHRPPVCRALIAVIRALLRLRIGDVWGAESEARAAVSQFSPAGWGIFSGVPASVLMLSAVAVGNIDGAADHLAIPVPDEIFSTVLGPVYLYARARYHLAAGNHALALRDFEMCGETESRWSPDRRGFVPWRVGAAEACVGLGNLSQGRRLLREHESLLDGKHGHGYGIWLRVWAAVSEPGVRTAQLKEAADLLERHADPLEATLALRALGAEHEATGAHQDAEQARRRASLLMHQHRAAAPDEPRPEGRNSGDSADRDPRLSGAEQRVASLAASGHTNREIAERLYVTVSTVEQHLTRAYRKLGVSSRADLLSLPLPNAISC